MGERVVLFDDTDGTIDETVAPRRFAFDGVPYVIDLSSRNWAKMVRVLQPYLERARPDRPAKGSRRAVGPQTGEPGTPVTPEPVPAQRRAEPVPVFAAPELPADDHQAEPADPSDPYAWTDDGRVSALSGVPVAELNACRRWVHSLIGKQRASRADVTAFRARDPRQVRGWVTIPEESEARTAVGKALVRAAQKKAAKKPVTAKVKQRARQVATA